MVHKLQTAPRTQVAASFPPSPSEALGRRSQHAAISMADALGAGSGELAPWQATATLPRGFGNVVPAYEREAWDAAAFVAAYDARCELLGLPGFEGDGRRLDYLATYTYPTSGCPTLASFAEQRVECDLFNG